MLVLSVKKILDFLEGEMMKEEKKYDLVKQKIHTMIKIYGDDNVIPAMATILIEGMGERAIAFIKDQYDFLETVKQHKDKVK